MRVLSGRAAVERTANPVESRAGAREPVGQHIVGECHDLVSRRMDIAVHVANEMTNPRSLGEIARMHHEDIFVGCTDHVSSFCVMVEKLSGMKNRARWQFEREHDAIRRFDETPHSAAIDSAHRQFDYR
jgi:hypothetical protein